MERRIAGTGRVGVGAGIDQGGGEFVVGIASGEVEGAGAGLGGAVRLGASTAG